VNAASDWQALETRWDDGWERRVRTEEVWGGLGGVQMSAIAMQ